MPVAKSGVPAMTTAVGPPAAISRPAPDPKGPAETGRMRPAESALGGSGTPGCSEERDCSLAATAVQGQDADLTDWHRSIFQTSFPGESGELRRHEETYGYVIGPRERPIPRQGRGTAWKRVPRRLCDICAEFNQEAERMDPMTAEQGLRLVDATRVAAQLYSKFLSIHPFEDGNGRTSFVLLSYALVRVDAVIVELAEYAELQWALGRALQPGGRRRGIEPLAELLAEKIRSAHAQDLS